MALNKMNTKQLKDMAATMGVAANKLEGLSKTGMQKVISTLLCQQRYDERKAAGEDMTGYVRAELVI